MKKDLKLLQNINLVNNSNLFLPNHVSIINNKYCMMRTKSILN